MGIGPRGERGTKGRSAGLKPSTSACREITGRHVFTAIAAFFGVVIAVNTVLAVFATTSWTGLVVENGYVASQKFNRDLAEARRQAALGWREEFGYVKGRLQLKLNDDQGRALTRSSVSVMLQRPSTDKEDRSVVLPETAAGVYALPIALKPGQWDADITVRASGEKIRRIYRFSVSDRG
jgi:nitrogen fixation protein FixH